MLVAEADGRLVGLRAFMRWRFVAGDVTLHAMRAVDTATHPEFQGRGIFSALTRRALGDLRGQADLIFNTPNEKSLPGYLKMGWTVVGQVPIYVRVRRPVRFVRHARSWKSDSQPPPMLYPNKAMSAGEVLGDPGVEELLRVAERYEGIATERSREYLRWRYADAPLLDYRGAIERAEGRARSLAIFRLRPRGAMIEATVSELISAPGDSRGARRALAHVAETSSSDHIACSFPAASSAMVAVRRSAFVRVPGGMTLVANPLGHDLYLDLLQLPSWSLSVGDLEVF